MIVAVNPKLVSYLRLNLPRFGEDALRDKLLEEDVSEDDIAAALAEARRPPRRRFRAARAAFSVLAGLLVFAALYKEEKKQEPDAGKEVGPSSATKAGPSSPFIGHGYLLKLPDGYAAQSVLRDMGRTEVVYIYPKKVDASHFNNEGLYGPLGLMRLEVSPRQGPQTVMGAASLRASVEAELSRRGEVYTGRDVLVGGLPGFVMSVSKPFPYARAFLLGSKSAYMLLGGSDDRLFTELLESITEARSRRSGR